MTTIDQAQTDAREIEAALQEAIRQLQVIHAPSPASPVERVMDGGKRDQQLTVIMHNLGAMLRQNRYSQFVAHGLVGVVRVLRGPRAETVFSNNGTDQMRFRCVIVANQPHHVEVECDIRAKT